MNENLWERGQVVVVREIWRGRVYSAAAMRVAEDSPRFSALYLSPRTPYFWPRLPDGGKIRLQADDWILREEPSPYYEALYLIQPGCGYTCVAVWNESAFDHWKINLEEPMRRTPLGFDHMDQLLDLLVGANRREWKWKDEDETRRALERGIFTAEQVGGLYQRGERALRALQNREPPFDREWESWKPQPDWRAPLRPPEGWTRV